MSRDVFGIPLFFCTDFVQDLFGCHCLVGIFFVQFDVEYESVSKISLCPRLNVALRVRGEFFRFGPDSFPSVLLLLLSA
jgi:hypothetical protein